jgi:hypothetical protein
MALDFTKALAPTRFPGGITTARPTSLLGFLEDTSPIHQVFLGWGYKDGGVGLPTGNTPTTNEDITITSVTSTGTASFNPAAVWPPSHLLTTGTTANDQVVFQDKRLVKVNMLGGLLRKVLVAGSFQITSTVANAKIALGMFSGTSIAALGNDQLTFTSSGATLNFVNRNNGGTALTTAISTALTINTYYGVAALLDPFKSTISVAFGVIDNLDLSLSTTNPRDLPGIVTIPVVTANIPDGTNSLQFGFGAQTTAGAAATVQFGPSFAALM